MFLLHRSASIVFIHLRSCSSSSPPTSSWGERLGEVGQDPSIRTPFLQYRPPHPPVASQRAPPSPPQSAAEREFVHE